MKENNIQDIISRLKQILKSKRYLNMISNPKINWLDLPIEDVINNVLDFFSSLDTIHE